MRLFRLEHTYCEGSPHGPVFGYVSDRCSASRGIFGFRGRAPEWIDEFEQCGVTADQIPDWHSNYTGADDAKAARDSGWRFIEYEIAPALARLDNNQYVCDLRFAEIVAEHDPVSVLFPQESESEQLALFAA